LPDADRAGGGVRGPGHRRPRGGVLGAAGVAAVILLLAGGSVVHVPEGDLGFTAGGRLLGPGWHLRTPFQRLRVEVSAGHLEAIDLDRRSPEGASVTVRLSLDYRLEAGALRSDAARVAAGGLLTAVVEAAGEALGNLPENAWLPADFAARGGGSVLPRSARDAIATALSRHGVAATALVARVAPAGTLPPPAAPAVASASSGEGGGAGATAGGPMPTLRPTGARVLMIGLDGADWDTIDPLVRQGRLPNLARLIARGVRAPLRSYDPMISPLLWTTMVTGVGPDLHGIADFQAIDAATGRRVPITSRFRKVKAVWNILSDASEPSDFVGWWASYPADRVEGVQVSNLVPFEALRPKPPGSTSPAGITWPEEYFARIRPRLKTAADLSYDEIRPILHIGREEFETARAEVLKPPAPSDDNANRKMVQKPVALAITILTGTKNYATIAADLARRHDPLTAVYFEGIDMMGHRFQHCMPPRAALCPAEDFARYRDAVTSFYQVQDRLLGPILEAAGSEVTVLVVSDHGFKTGDGRPRDLLPFTTDQPVEWHDEEGIFLLSGPASRHDERLAARPTLFDIMPTLLYLMGLPQSQTMPGHVLIGALEPGLAARGPLPPVSSYETLGGSRTIAAASGNGAEEAERELLASLRDLGYIGGDPSPAAGTQGGAPAPARPPATGEQTQVFYHRNLATFFLKRQEYAKAAEQLRLANDREKLPKNYQMLSEAYFGLGRIDEAIATLEEGFKALDRMDPESVLWLVRIELSRPGGREAALDAARRFAPRTAKSPGLDDAIAGLLAEDARDPRAADLYRRSLDADPTRVLAAERLFAIEGLPAAADLEPVLRRALAKDPRIDEYHNLLGMILMRRGGSTEAVTEFRRASDVDPDNARFASNLAAALARAGRWPEAGEAYERAAVLDPSPPNFLKLGSVYRRLKRPDRALAAFERARALGDDGSGPILGIALARAELHQIPEAMQAAKEGLDRHPDDPGLRSLYDDLLRRTRSPGSPPGPPGSAR
jgi:tetratricopeptide (TPR) repeat protein/predicted AlkP superfamily pyrophosphatase or phosphodiesterase